MRGAGRGCPRGSRVLGHARARQLQRPPARRRRARTCGGRRGGIPSPRRVRGKIRCGRRTAGVPRRRPPQVRARLRRAGGRRGSRGARDRGRGSRRGTPAARPHRTESSPASCSRGSSECAARGGDAPRGSRSSPHARLAHCGVPPMGRGRARRLRGSPREASLPAPGPRGDSLRPASAGAGTPPRRPPQARARLQLRRDATTNAARVAEDAGAAEASPPPPTPAPSPSLHEPQPCGVGTIMLGG